MAPRSFNKFQPGNRLQSGDHLNNIFLGYEYIANANVSGTLAVTGAVTFSGGLNVTGNTTQTGNTFQSGYAADSVASALTAVGTNRGTALVIAKQINNITTAAASTGAVLPLGSAVGLCAPIFIFNGGANPITVYASGTDTIDTVAGATGVTLTNAKRCMYFPVSVSAGVTTWISAQLGVISA